MMFKLKSIPKYSKLPALLLTILSLILLSSGILKAQIDPTVEWANTLLKGESIGGNLYVFDVVEDAPGNTYISGWFTGAADFDPSANSYPMTSYGQWDLFLAKYDASGALVYAVQAGSSNIDIGLSVAVDSDGNAYVSGFIEGDATVTSYDGTAIEVIGASTSVPFFAKYDVNGQLVHAHSLTGNNGQGRANDITIANDGSIIVVGEFSGTIDFDLGSGVESRTAASGIIEGFIARYDQTGDLDLVVATSSTSYTFINSINVDENLNMIVGGTFSGTTNFDPNGSSTLVSGGTVDIFFARYDYDGNYVYRKGLRGSGSNEFGYFGDITLDTAGNIYLTGNVLGTYDIDPSNGPSEEFYITSPVGSDEMFFAKYNVVGQFQYAKKLTGNAESKGIDIGDNDQLFITGSFGGTVNFDGSGGVFNMISNGGQDVFVARYTSVNGNISSAMSFGGSGVDGGEAITVNNTTGKIKVVGTFKNTVDFDPSGAASNLTAGGSFSNGFLGQYASIGQFQQVGQLGQYGSSIPNGNYDHYVNAITMDNNENLIIAGAFSGDVDFDPGQGLAELSGNIYSEVFVAKYDKDGSYKWAFKLDGDGELMELFDVETDNAGNIYIIGTFNANSLDLDPSSGQSVITNTSSKGVFLAKYNAGGALVYANGFQANDITDLVVDNSGNAFISGSFGGTLDMDPSAGVSNVNAPVGYFNSYVAKYDAAGGLLFANSYSGNGNSRATAVTLDKLGRFYVTGFFDNTIDVDLNSSTQVLDANNGDLFVVKYANDGSYLSSINMGGGTYVRAIAVDDDMNMIIAGSYYLDLTLDPTGGSAGNITIDPSGSDDLFLAKYNESGTLIFAHGFPSAGYHDEVDIVVDRMNDIYMAGYFYETIDFDPNLGIANLPGSSRGDGFLAKYSPTGNYVYAVRTDCSGYAAFGDVEIDNKGGIFLAGHFDEHMDIEYGAGIYNLFSLNDITAFMVKYVDCIIEDIEVTASGTSLIVTGNYDSYQWLLNGQPIAGALANSYTLTSSGNYSVQVSSGNCTASSTQRSYTLDGGTIGIEDIENINSFKLYPNPSIGLVTIELNAGASISNVNVLDLSGRVVKQVELEGQLLKLDLSAYGAGIYFVEVTTEGGRSIQKLVLTK